MIIKEAVATVYLVTNFFNYHQNVKSSSTLTDSLTMKGVLLIIFAIRYSYKGTSTNGKIINISSSNPRVVIRPHSSVS